MEKRSTLTELSDENMEEKTVHRCDVNGMELSGEFYPSVQLLFSTLASTNCG